MLNPLFGVLPWITTVFVARWAKGKMSLHTQHLNLAG